MFTNPLHDSKQLTKCWWMRTVFLVLILTGWPHKIALQRVLHFSGVPCFTPNGEKVGLSPNAAREGITKVVLSRVCMAAPGMVRPPSSFQSTFEPLHSLISSPRSSSHWSWIIWTRGVFWPVIPGSMHLYKLGCAGSFWPLPPRYVAPSLNRGPPFTWTNWNLNWRTSWGTWRAQLSMSTTIRAFEKRDWRPWQCNDADSTWT